jgi:hypothetical protein
MSKLEKRRVGEQENRRLQIKDKRHPDSYREEKDKANQGESLMVKDERGEKTKL